MCTERYELDYERTDDMSVLFDFYCSIDDMDNYIHTHLQDKIDREKEKGCESFIIRKDGSIVAMTALIKKAINIEINGEVFSLDALEIEYLAVRKDMQRKKIGKQILEWIEQRAKENYNNIRYLSVCAYVDHDFGYTAEPFYAKRDFYVTKIMHPMMDYVKMVKILR